MDRARAIASRRCAVSRRSRARCARSASTPRADDAHPRDPHHVVGAHLQAIQRLLHGGLRALQVALAPAAARRAARRTCRSTAARPRPARAARRRRAPPEPGPRRPCPSASSASREWAEDPRHSEQPHAAADEVLLARRSQSPASNAVSETVSFIQSWRAQAARRGGQPLLGGRQRLLGAPGHAEHVGEVRVGGGEAVDVARCPAPAGPPGAAAPVPLNVAERHLGHAERVEQLGLRATDRPPARAVWSAGSPSIAASRKRPRRKRVRASQRQQLRAHAAGVVVGQHRQRALGDRHRLLAAVQRPDRPRLARQQHRVARGLAVGVQLLERLAHQHLGPGHGRRRPGERRRPASAGRRGPGPPPARRRRRAATAPAHAHTGPPPRRRRARLVRGARRRDRAAQRRGLVAGRRVVAGDRRDALQLARRRRRRTRCSRWRARAMCSSPRSPGSRSS